ncbi:PREDICTED: forkhead box protein J1-A-like [Cyprinodon variegatus]|nr:PREDICTED: forkhead box protein J1-A-like [Cyprinodon variegatus]XP_015248586.1 PREDICTED: forkhead box protein J1-A-like [Cyprinodon variegatus]
MLCLRPEGREEEEEEAQAGQRDSGFSGLDDSLTSLQWLQEFSILGAPGPQPVQQQLGPEGPASPLAADPASSMGAPLTPGKPTAAAFSRMQTLPGLVAHGHCPAEVDYRSDPRVKPPYSYATLICMAMQASKQSKITLSCIYQWITDNFCYYRHADPTWQNSIRHNLSLNKCFIKVPRNKDEPGKGGFWKIDPQYTERLLSGAYKKRRMPPVQINPALQTRLGLSLPAPSAGTPAGLNVSAESKRFLREFEEETQQHQNRDPRLSEGTMLGSWPGTGERNGYKRKLGSRNGASKASRRSSSPLFCVDEPREAGPLKGPFDWDGLLDSALRGELSLDGGDPLSPVMKEEGPAERGGQRGAAPQSSDASDFDEETLLATAFLETPWPEDEDQGCGDFLNCSNLEQLFDLGDSLEVGASSRMEPLL